MLIAGSVLFQVINVSELLCAWSLPSAISECTHSQPVINYCFTGFTLVFAHYSLKNIEYIISCLCQKLAVFHKNSLLSWRLGLTELKHLLCKVVYKAKTLCMYSAKHFAEVFVNDCKYRGKITTLRLRNKAHSKKLCKYWSPFCFACVYTVKVQLCFFRHSDTRLYHGTAEGPVSHG